MRIVLAFLMVLLLTPVRGKAQSYAFSVKFTGLAIHPRKETNAGIYRSKFGQKGYLVLNSGVTLSAEIGIWRQIGVKVAQALVWRDCAGKFASLSHVGINFGGAGATLGNSRHGISGSVGPMIYRRKSWKDIPGYVSDDSWLKGRENSDWETKIIPIGGQFEYNYYFSGHYGMGVNVLPGYPDIISVVAGPTVRNKK